MKKIHTRYISAVCILLLAYSCSTRKFISDNHTTSRNTHTDTPENKENNDKERDKLKAYYSEKLGITLEAGFNKDLLKEVVDWLGVPYKYGGASKQGTDCSGFVQQVYKVVFNLATARSASGVYEQSTRLKRDKLSQGELVFFKINTEKVGHVGIFLQDPYFIHASSSKGVMVSSLDASYWSKYFVSGGRITP